MSNFLFTSSLIVCLFASFSCSPQPKADTSPGSKGDNSMNSLDWDGTYTGNLPCADCESIRTVLRISRARSYSQKTMYMGKSSAIYESRGTFQWNELGNTITLIGTNGVASPNSFFVGENTLTQLDMNGQKISGALAEKYILRKVPAGITEKYWKLTELYGKPLTHAEASAHDAHMILKRDGMGVQGNAGCNSFAGSYELEAGDRISFSKIALTQMACPDMDTESTFLKALNTTDSYFLRGDTLILNKARMAPLARFEAIYLR